MLHPSFKRNGGTIMCLLCSLRAFTEKQPPEGTDLFVCENPADPQKRTYGIMRFFQKRILIPGINAHRKIQQGRTPDGCPLPPEQKWNPGTGNRILLSGNRKPGRNRHGSLAPVSHQPTGFCLCSHQSGRTITDSGGSALHAHCCRFLY